MKTDPLDKASNIMKKGSETVCYVVVVVVVLKSSADYFTAKLRVDVSFRNIYTLSIYTKLLVVVMVN